MKIFHFLGCVCILLGTAFAAPNTFKPFTGKILGNKVRLRSSPDLQGAILTELNRDDLLLVVNEIGNFYAVEAPTEVNAYIYRTYLFDGKIDANRVNVRLAPNKEAPILGCLSQGDTVQIKGSSSDGKWLQISAPKTLPFYISKDFIAYAGSSAYLTEMQKRKEKLHELLQEATVLSQQERKKPFEKMQPQEAIVKLQSVIEKYPEFKAEVLQAKTHLAALQETYLEKKLSYLNSVQKKESDIEDVVFPTVKKETYSSAVTVDTWKRQNPNIPNQLTPKMKAWIAAEKELFDSWVSFNPNKQVGDFYQEQKVNALTVTGVLQAYDPNIHNRPGDYVLRKNGAFVAFLYSTHLNLDEHLGKKVNLLVSPRPNNHFAFPAYFVLDVE